MTNSSGKQRRTFSDADFRLMVEAMPHMTWMAAADGTNEYLNPAGVTYTGFPADGAGWSWPSLVHPDDVASAGLAWPGAPLPRAQWPARIDCRIRRFDGEYRWHAFGSRPICDQFGAVVRWVGTAVDIDDAKKSETDLRSAERRAAETSALLETLQSKAPIGFGFVDRDLRMVRVNESLAAMTGISAVDQIGRSVESVVPQLWAQIEPLYRSVLDTGKPLLDLMVDGPLPADPVQQRHWLSSYYPVWFEDEVIGVGLVAVDVTALRQAQDAHRRLSAIVEDSGDAIVSAALDGVVTSWNTAAEKLFGYDAGEMIGRRATELVPAGSIAAVVAAGTRILAGGTTEHLEIVTRRQDGSEIEVLVSFSPVTDIAGKLDGLSVIAQDITERRTAERTLQASRLQLAEAQQIAHLGSFQLDLRTGAMTWSAELFHILGLDPEVEPTAELFFSAIHPEDQRVMARARADVVEQGLAFDIVHRIIRPDGGLRWVNARAVAERGHDGTVIRLAGTLRDNTDKVEAERVRHTAEALFEVAFEQSGIGAAIMDLGGIPRRLNAAACQILGRPEEQLIDRSWVEFNHPEESPLADAMIPWLTAGHEKFAEERRFLRPDGSVLWASLHVSVVRDDEGKPQYYMVQLQDITARRLMERELAHQALHDSMTGLPNRALLTDRLVQGLAGTRLRGTRLAVIFVNIDHFKQVNDSLGHARGDELIRQAADRLVAVVRPSDTVARFGSDEFVVVYDDVNAAQAEHIAARMLHLLGQPYQVRNQQVQITVSMGIAIADADSTPESLLRDADAAMHLAKARGRGRVELFDEVLRSRAQRRTATAAGLRQALDRGEFIVYYQPIVDITTGVMVSAEALLRWEHPEGSLVGPAEFIPMAEETGLIVPMGAWVMEQACLQLVGWHAWMPSMTVSVNLSIRQIVDADVVALVADVLTRTGAPPASLCLELTESVFMEDAEYFGRTLAGLRQLGVTLAIDDFGTGYSSLSYLKRFPVNVIKVDKAFVDGLGTDPHDSALVAAIVAMADALGLLVTAEGVENPEQLAILKKLQCQRAQGFYLARPMPADEMNRLVAESHRWLVD